MSLIQEKRTTTNITRDYRSDSLGTNKDVVRWLSDARNITGLTTKYIELCDLEERSDEGSNSRQLEAEVCFDDLEKAFDNSSVDLILLVGHYYNKPIVVGFDLVERVAYITIRKKSPADIDDLEVQLKLV